MRIRISLEIDGTASTPKKPTNHNELSQFTLAREAAKARCVKFRAMSELGQKAKYSRRAHVFRFTPDNGHAAAAPQ
jgi:hypothetical protein